MHSPSRFLLSSSSSKGPWDGDNHTTFLKRPPPLAHKKRGTLISASGVRSGNYGKMSVKKLFYLGKDATRLYFEAFLSPMGGRRSCFAGTSVRTADLAVPRGIEGGTRIRKRRLFFQVHFCGGRKGGGMDRLHASLR